jgi:hypothetical protein
MSMNRASLTPARKKSGGLRERLLVGWKNTPATSVHGVDIERRALVSTTRIGNRDAGYAMCVSNVGRGTWSWNTVTDRCAGERSRDVLKIGSSWQ